MSTGFGSQHTLLQSVVTFAPGWLVRPPSNLPADDALSPLCAIADIAAQQNHREACFALTAWYLVGSPGVLPQSDTEAYLWAKKAAEQGLAKAEYAVGCVLLCIHV